MTTELERLVRPNVILRVIAWITGGNVVWIKDRNGEVRQSVAYRDSFGQMYCRVHFLTQVGHCLLLPDGSVDPSSQSSYVKNWKAA